MESDIWEMVTNPYLLGICTILGIPIGLLGIRRFSNNQTKNVATLERIIEKETIQKPSKKPTVKKKREPVEAITKAAMIAPVAYKTAEVSGDILKQKIAASLGNTDLDRRAVEMAGTLSVDALEAIEGSDTLLEGIAEAAEKVM